MRIDGTYRPQMPGLTPTGEAAGSAKAVDADRVGQAGLDQPAQASAVSADSLAAYVAKAKAAPAVRADAVAEARRLMESGELDTPEAAARAAEAIVDRGI